MTVRMIGTRGRLIALAIAALSIAPAASAAPRETIDVELNRLQQVDDACRMIIVFTNHMAAPVRSLEVETVLFDREGRVERFLVLKAQPLAPQKIRVHQYDLAGTACDTIGSVLVNDVVGCEGDALTPALCLERIAVSSRETAKLVLSASEPETVSEGGATGETPPAQ